MLALKSSRHILKGSPIREVIDKLRYRHAKYTSVGCYPLFYVNKQCAVLCDACANKTTKHLTAAVNWENPQLYCDECSERIESAYAEDEHEQQQNA